jgi:hypothetical protein
MVNDGAPIDRDGEAAIDLAAMMSANFHDTGGDAGLSFNLDNAPHAAVHIDVGTRQRGMATVAWAANDPVFWLHHSNIDRIWASWNRAGGRNPDDEDFLAAEFAFVDETGRLARTAVGDAIDPSALGYAYDRYLARPFGSLPFPGDAAAKVTEHAGARIIPPIGPSSEALTITLATNSADPAGALRDALERGQVVFLRFGGVRIVRQPKVTYRLYLAPEPGFAATLTDPAHIGDINAFGVVPREGDTRPGPATTVPRAYSFVVTERIRQLLQAGRATAPLRLVFIPTGAPAPDTSAAIDAITLLSV